MQPQSVAAPPRRVPRGANEQGDGIVLGTGPVTVEAYIDFQCPFCRQFEERAGSMLSKLVRDEIIELTYHPIGFLDRLSTARYSSRASAASGCAADEGRFAEYKDALFANQPPEGGPGLSDEELVALGVAVGLTVDGFGRCVAEGAYLPWTAYVTERAVVRGVAGTPSVFVSGVPVPANPVTIAAAVADLAP